jgi:hypothetical protein
MKQLFRCEYCDQTGTAEEIQKHEEECMYNYNKRSCWTCKHAEVCLPTVTCKAGKEIPKDNYIKNCDRYENDGKDHTKPSAAKYLFGGLF